MHGNNEQARSLFLERDVLGAATRKRAVEAGGGVLEGARVAIPVGGGTGAGGGLLAADHGVAMEFVGIAEREVRYLQYDKNRRLKRTEIVPFP